MCGPGCYIPRSWWCVRPARKRTSPGGPAEGIRRRISADCLRSSLCRASALCRSVILLASRTLRSRRLGTMPSSNAGADDCAHSGAAKTMNAARYHQPWPSKTWGRRMATSAQRCDPRSEPAQPSLEPVRPRTRAGARGGSAPRSRARAGRAPCAPRVARAR